MKELDIVTELSDSELEMINGRGGYTGGGEGGYGGKGKGGFEKVQGYRNDNQIINNFSFRNNTNIGGLATIPVTVSDFTCNDFGNTYIGY
ncbi:hypothetical protein [Ktedonospora formicarum]|uniref:Uncharacterized protein n=1 Tax=Ktedonospora formicarum TaxID=2778364 RepID=A0A8J3MSI2_9CHLR|nr:hypothetical protein [Ktedonospora formicarum]GHO46150.1 hypothetical protein KSX_43130 [Ktedonospora formicarum]